MIGCCFRNDSPVDAELRVKTGSLAQWSGSRQETTEREREKKRELQLLSVGPHVSVLFR